jgi:proton-dependent oligopeptide transporter, POT family
VKTGIAGHPRGLAALFLTEMWERFSYYGMRAMIVIYLTQAVGWTEARASVLYLVYTSTVWLTPILGGLVADRFWGAQKALLVGGLIIASGHFVLAIESMTAFYVGLGLVAFGTGFFKPNVSTCVGELYGTEDPRRDSGYTIFYMGINVGAALGPIVTGYLRTRYGWPYGFAAAGFGMLFAVVTLQFTRKKFLGEAGLRPNAEREKAKTGETSPMTHEEWDRVIALFIVSFFVIFFWAAYEQAGNSMNLFAANNTRLELGSVKLVPEWFQSVDAIVVLAFAPVFAMVWPLLRKRGLEPSTTRKMALGLVVLGLGFLFMIGGAKQVNAGRLAHPGFLIMAYVFHTWGELCLSPVGLSLVSKVAPGKIVSLMMGVWFLSNWAGNFAAGLLGVLRTRIADPVQFWTILAIFPVVTGLVLFFGAPKLQKLMHGHG